MYDHLCFEKKMREILQFLYLKIVILYSRRNSSILYMRSNVVAASIMKHKTD